MVTMTTSTDVEGDCTAVPAAFVIQPANVDECAFVRSLQAGEEWAFAAMVRLFGGRLLTVARRILRNEEDARDVVQIAYMNAFRAIGSFEADCRLSTWLHKITVNAALMKLRSRSRKPEESIERWLPTFDEGGHHVEPVSRWPSPERVVADAETRALVRECIDQLPDGYREVLILRDLEERSFVEIAQALSTTPNAVKIRVHRARQALVTLTRMAVSRTHPIGGCEETTPMSTVHAHRHRRSA
jgi:RNA polymerase sigma-70 factor (ECF subfamily)